MSALELYTPPNYIEASPLLYTIISIFVIMALIQKVHSSDERIETIKARIEDLTEKINKDITQLYDYTLKLDNSVELIQNHAEDNVDSRIKALENTAIYLTVTDNAHEDLLKEHSEDISLTAETAYRAAELSPTQNAHLNDCTTTFAQNIQYLMDEPIKNFLRASPKKTARQIFNHLSQNETFKGEWKRNPAVVTREMTRHDVNSRLYSLLAQGALMKDDSARPVWSLVSIGIASCSPT